MQDILHIHVGSPLSYDDSDVPLKEKRINFQKFYDMYSIAAELEAFRLSSFKGKLTGNRETNGMLMNHIRAFVQNDTDSSLAYGTLYATGSNPSENAILNSSDASKALKKIVSMMTQTS